MFLSQPGITALRTGKVGRRGEEEEEGRGVSLERVKPCDGDGDHSLRSSLRLTQTIEPVSACGRLYTVGDEVSARERVGHGGGPHADPVADADGSELVTGDAGLVDALLDDLAQVEEVAVAGVALVPDRGDADHGALQVGVRGDAFGGVEHGLRSTLVLGLRDDARVPVQVRAGTRALARGGGGGAIAGSREAADANPAAAVAAAGAAGGAGGCLSPEQGGCCSCSREHSDAHYYSPLR